MTEEMIKMWHTYIQTMEYYSDIKRMNNAICSNKDGPRDYHTKWSKSEKDKHHDITYMWNLIKMMQMNLFTKQKQNQRFCNQTYGCQRGNVGGGIN